MRSSKGCEGAVLVRLSAVYGARLRVRVSAPSPSKDAQRMASSDPMNGSRGMSSLSIVGIHFFGITGLGRLTQVRRGAGERCPRVYGPASM